MNRYSVNGVEKAAPVGNEETLHELLAYINCYVVNDQSLLSSIRLDGVEIFGREFAYADLPLSEIESLEITCASPREMTEDTLQGLIPYLQNIENLCSSASMRLCVGEPAPELFKKILDELATFIEGINSAKDILKVRRLRAVSLLEAEMLWIMKDLYQAHQTNNSSAMLAVLREQLPEHLRQWRESGLPALIRCRDN